VSQDVAGDPASAVFQDDATHHQLGCRKDSILLAYATLLVASTLLP
jgi:hypothetical protein